MAIHFKQWTVCWGLVALPLLALGWGAGHDTVARAAAGRGVAAVLRGQPLSRQLRAVSG